MKRYPTAYPKAKVLSTYSAPNPSISVVVHAASTSVRLATGAIQNKTKRRKKEAVPHPSQCARK